MTKQTEALAEQPTNMVTIPLDKLEDMQRRLKTTQEPFGIWHVGDTEEESDFFLYKDSGDVSCEHCIKLYTHPKQWQGLSDDEIWDIANFLGKNKEWDYPVMFAKTIEKVLREKNHE